MKPQEFLETSNRLSSSTHEADLRSAISRAYYAAMHTAMDALPQERKNSLRVNISSSHEQVIGTYDAWCKGLCQNRSDKRTIRDLLIKLKKNRKHADYTLDEALSSGMVEDTIDGAGIVISLASNLETNQ